MGNYYYRIFYYVFLCCLLTGSTCYTYANTGNKRGEAQYFGHSGNFRYIENAGQWHDNVAYQSALSSGSLFLEEDAFTFLLYDAETLHFDHYHNQNPRGQNDSSHHHSGGGEARSLPDKIQYHAFKMHINNADPDTIEGRDAFPTEYNFYLGNDKSKWASGVTGYDKICYRQLYEGIDAVVYSEDNHLKYDFIVNEGVDAGQISLSYEGLDHMALNDGDLVLHTALGNIVEKKPYAYQVIDGQKTEVPCRFVHEGETVAFEFPEGYDREHQLIIDPELIFSTYSGSYSNNFGYTASFDSKGFLYSGSTAFGNEYPVTMGAFEEEFEGGNTDIALSKYDTSGTFMVYSTYLGGGNDELPHSLIVNEDDELYAFGTTSSPDFPVTAGAYDITFNGGTTLDGGGSYSLIGLGVNYNNGSDIIISKLSADGGQLEASTFVGGSGNDGLNSTAPWFNADENHLRYNYADEVRGEIDIDRSGTIFLATCTRSEDFPIAGNGVQPTYGGGDLDGVMLKMDQNLETIIWSSYLGGSGDDAIYSLSIDQHADLYVTGGTRSQDFPVSDSGYMQNYQGGRADGFITHVSEEGDSIMHSTYFGSDEYDQSYFVELDRYDSVYVYGQTEKMDSTFIKDAGYAIEQSGQFISKFTPGLDSLAWSTVFGNGSGGPGLSPTAFLVDLCHKIYISGWGGSTNYEPTSYLLDDNGDPVYYLSNNAGFTDGMDITSDAFQSTTDGSDFYLMILEDDASDIFYGSYMGGGQAPEHVDGGTSRFDRKGKIYQSVCAGCHGYSDFPIEPDDAVSPQNNSSCNNAVFKFDFLIPTVVADFDAPEVVCGAPADITFENLSLEQDNTNYHWSFGDGDTAVTKNPVHTYEEPGTYEVKLVVSDTATCNLADSISRNIRVIKDTTYALNDQQLCKGDSLRIGFADPPDTSYTYRWYPAGSIEDPRVPDPVVYPGETTEYTVYMEGEFCTFTSRQTVNVDSVNITPADDRTVCSDDPPVELDVAANGSNVSYIWAPSPDFDQKINAGNESTVTVNPLEEENTYYVKVIDQFGCQAVDSVNIYVSDIATEVSDDQYICTGDSANLSLTTDNPLDTLTYNWEPEDAVLTSPDSSEVVVQPSASTNFTVYGQNQHGCVYNRQVQVTLSPLTTGSITAYADTNIILEGRSTYLHVEPRNYDYRWTPAGSLSDPYVADPRASPEAPTTYEVVASDPELARCQAVDTVSIDVIPVVCGPPNLYIPNAFTPNGDNKNDEFRIRGNHIEKIYLAVYNRWGEKVFESHRQEKGWDGTFRGRAVDPGVFDYYLEVTCVGQKTYFTKGNVTLIR